MTGRVRWIDRTGIAATGLFALALIVRLVYLWQSAAGPTFLNPVVDSETYDRLARDLVAGGGLTHEHFWQPVFYPLWLAAVYGVSGASITLAKLLQALIGATTVVLTFRLGRRLFGSAAGLLAGLMLALYGPAIFFDGELLATGWAGLWSVALVLLLLWAAERGPSAGLALGLCGALATITRPTFLPFFLAGCAWLWIRGSQRRGAQLLLALAGFALIAIPVALASQTYSGRLSILPASAGLNLHIGNNPDSASTIAIRPGADWLELTRSPRRHGITQRKDTGRYFRRQVLNYVLGDPAGFARGLLIKTGHFLSSRELPRNLDIYLFREESTLLRGLVWKVGGFGFPFGVLLPLAVMGVVMCRRRLPAPLILFLVLYPLAVVLVFVSARYRTPLVPVLAVVAAGGCLELYRAAAGRRFRELAVAAIAALACLLLGVLPGPYPQERADHRAELHYFLGTRALNSDDLAAALDQLDRAVERQPDHSDAHNQLGLVHIKRRDLKAATLHLEAAIRHNPRSVVARTNLARLYAAGRRYDAAFEQFEAALAQDPFDVEAHRHYGLTLLKRDRRREAAHHLGLVVEVRPDDREARRALELALAPR